MNSKTMSALRKTAAATLAVALIPLAGVTAANAATPAPTATNICSTMTTSIYKAVNPKTAASLLTTNSKEIASANTKYGFTDTRGTLFKAASKTGTGLEPVYRLQKNNDFIYLPSKANSNELANAQNKYGYKAQGINFYASDKALSCTVPVYRYLKGSIHRYVVDAAEQKSLTAAGWKNEGVVFNVLKATATTTPVTTPPTTTPTAPATPPVTAPSTNPALPTQGSATVGTTNYAIPSNALFVATTGSDTATGTVNAPFKTVNAALAKAVSGQTIVMRGGEYNQSVNVPYSKGITIQSYPYEAVWFDGSKKVTSWEQNGSTWTTNWDFFTSTAIDGVDDNPRYVDPSHSQASKRDQVFYNGEQLTQVGSASAVTTGTFYADPSAKTITIGSDPFNNEVRISNLSAGIMVNSANSTMQGFGVRRYATNSTDQAGIRMVNVNATARNLDIEDNAYIGLSMSNNNAKVDHVTVLRNGLLGLGSNAAYGSSFTNNRIEYNNYQQFKTAPVAGGFKITRSRDVTIDNNNSSNNYGAGIWLDESVYNSTITNNTTNNDKSVGIMVELSQKAIVANNTASSTVSGSGSKQQDGVVIRNSGDVKVFNNDFENNSRFAVSVHQDERLASQPNTAGHDPRQPVPDPTVPWISKDIVVANNAFGATLGFQFYALNAPDKNITLTGNLFNVRAQTGQQTVVAWGVDPNSKDAFIRYDTPDALVKNIDSSWKNAITTSITPISGMSAQEDDVASNIATPLPADIAALVWQSTGVQHVGTF